VSQGGALSYEAKLDAFLDGMGEVGRAPGAVRIFHSVRNIPYASRGSRDPAEVLEANQGSCSGKHLLLRDLLRRSGEVAEIETVEGDFAAGLPEVETMPPALRAWVRDGGIRDFHQYVVWSGPEGESKLDATWPDYLARFGFSTNSAWDGSGDTVIALTPTRVVGRVEDLIPFKEGLLASLSPVETADRLAFLSLLTDWLAEQSKERSGDGE
jgi:hypothetical protein